MFFKSYASHNCVFFLNLEVERVLPESFTTLLQSSHYTVSPPGYNSINPHWNKEESSSTAQFIFPPALFQDTE